MPEHELETFIKTWEATERMRHTRLLNDLKRECEAAPRSDSGSISEEEEEPIAPGSIGVPRSVMQQRKPMSERKRPLSRERK